MNAENNKSPSAPEDKPKIDDNSSHREEEDHRRGRPINPTLDPNDKNDCDNKQKLVQIIKQLDTLLEERLLIRKPVPGKPTNGLEDNFTKQAENHYSRNLRQHVGTNNSNLARGRKATKYTGMVAKCQTHQLRQYIQETLLNSIDVQISLGELITETKDRDVAIGLTKFMKANVNQAWLAAHSDSYEAGLLMHAQKASETVKSLLDCYVQTPSATDGTLGSATRSNTLLKPSFGQTSMSPGPPTQTHFGNCFTKTSRTSSVPISADKGDDKSPENETEPVSSSITEPFRLFTDNVQHSTTPRSPTDGQPVSIRTKPDIMFNLELEGSHGYAKPMHFMEHHSQTNSLRA